MDKEKYEQVLKYFTDEGISLPTEAKNAIEDIFMENDNIDSVQCYYSSELEDFLNDITLKNETIMFMDGHSRGTIYNVYTYCGDTQISLSEYTVLAEKEPDENEEINVLETITNYQAEGKSIVFNSKEYNFVLLEKIHWEAPGEIKKENSVYLYCPVNDEGEK